MLSLIFIRFYALDLFALSLVQAPSDILIFFAIAVMSLLNLTRTSSRMLCALCGIFGALVFALDFLHGALPLGLVALIGCGAMTADRHSWDRHHRTHPGRHGAGSRECRLSASPRTPRPTIF